MASKTNIFDSNNLKRFFPYRKTLVYLEQTAIPNTKLTVKIVSKTKFLYFGLLFSGPVRVGYAVTPPSALFSDTCVMAGKGPVENHKITTYEQIHVITWDNGAMVIPLFRGLE